MHKNGSLRLGNIQYDTTHYDHRIPAELMDSSKRNLHELAKLIHRLFEYHSRILVVRVDLRYKKEYGHRMPVEIAQRHRAQLLGDRRANPNIFDHLLGYAWGFEYGEQEGGYHYHFLAFYNGASRRDDVGIGMAIQDYWDNVITNGMGQCYISNFDKAEMTKQGCLGIGMIHRNDVATRINLIERVAAYLTKKCSIIDIQSGRTESGEFRTFGKSWMRPPLDESIPRRGRPPVG